MTSSWPPDEVADSVADRDHGEQVNLLGLHQRTGDPSRDVFTCWAVMTCEVSPVIGHDVRRIHLFTCR